MPITLDVTKEFVAQHKIAKGTRLTLRDFRDDAPLAIFTGTLFLLAIAVTHPADCTRWLTLAVEDAYTPDVKKEAQEVFGTVDDHHPAVNYLFKETKDTYIGGTLQAISLPAHYDFTDLRCTSLFLNQQH